MLRVPDTEANFAENYLTGYHHHGQQYNHKVMVWQSMQWTTGKYIGLTGLNHKACLQINNQQSMLQAVAYNDRNDLEKWSVSMITEGFHDAKFVINAVLRRNSSPLAASKVVMKTESWQNANFVVPGGTVGCHNHNLPVVPPVATKLASWQLPVFSVHVSSTYQIQYATAVTANTRRPTVTWKPHIVLTELAY